MINIYGIIKSFAEKLESCGARLYDWAAKRKHQVEFPNAYKPTEKSGKRYIQLK